MNPRNTSEQVAGSVLMTHAVGLHARPSVTLTKLAKTFSCQAWVASSAQGPWIDAKSISRVMKMKAPQDTILYFKAEGEDAKQAVQAFVHLVENDFKMA